MRQIFGDYEFAGIVSAASGRPITVLQGTEISGTGIGNDRGTLIPGSSPYSKNSCAGVTATCVSWMNPSAFQPTKTASGANNPAIFGTFGNIGKNPYRLPKTSDWDVTAFQEFHRNRALESPAPRRVFQCSESSELCSGERQHGSRKQYRSDQRIRQTKQQFFLRHIPGGSGRRSTHRPTGGEDSVLSDGFRGGFPRISAGRTHPKDG